MQAAGLAHLSHLWVEPLDMGSEMRHISHIHGFCSTPWVLVLSAPLVALSVLSVPLPPLKCNAVCSKCELQGSLRQRPVPIC